MAIGLANRQREFLQKSLLLFCLVFSLSQLLGSIARAESNEKDFMDEPETPSQGPPRDSPPTTPLLPVETVLPAPVDTPEPIRNAQLPAKVSPTANAKPKKSHAKRPPEEDEVYVPPPTPSPKPPPDIPDVIGNGWDQTLVETDRAIAEWFNGAADGIDLFLMGRRLTDKPNNTQVQIENSTFSSSGRAPNNTSSINVNLRLPNVEEYWQVKFASYDEQEEARNVQNGYLRTTPRERNPGATVGFFRKLGNIRTAFQPRVGFNNPFKVAHSLSFESVVDYKIFQFNPKVEFYAKPDDGTGIFIRLNFNYIMTPIFSLTQTNEGEYKERLHLFTGTNGLTLGQGINDRNSISYSLVFSSVSQPSYMLDGYSFAISYNHLIYKKILDMQLIPHWDFPYAVNFHGTPGIAMNFNLYF